MNDSLSSEDRLYSFNEEATNAIREGKAWMKDAVYFKRVKISPTASIKMMTHCQSGVEKGIKKNGVPVEVMGFLLGRPDTDDPHAMIISDAQALPIEGFETSVVADDQSIINYQIALQEVNELTRKEVVCGWYHSHPFDLDGTNHCYLSKTDVTTQTLWQNHEDNHGNPFLAIVVDPLLSLSKSEPVIRAFRVYPAGYTPPKNQTPDGEVVDDVKVAMERWGACWDNYYMLEVSYFMSQLASETLNTFRDKFMWMNALISNPLSEPAKQKDLLELLMSAKKESDKFTSSCGKSGGHRQIHTFISKGFGKEKSSEVQDTHSPPTVTKSGLDVAVQHCQSSIGLLAKNIAFGEGKISDLSSEDTRNCSEHIDIKE